MGFPCKHMIFVMKHEHLTEIPNQLVLKRWRKDAKSLQQYMEIRDDESERAFLMRQGALHAASQRLVFLGAKSKDVFDFSVHGLVRLCEEVEGRINGGAKAAGEVNMDDTIKDPAVVKTKGAPRKQKINKGKKRRCTNCRMPGHTKRHCRDEQSDGGQGENVIGNADGLMRSQCSSHCGKGSSRENVHETSHVQKNGLATSPESASPDEYLQQVQHHSDANDDE